MVDAINSNSTIKPQDLSINWNGCTAMEILEYQDEGQDIPSAILTWAEDMAKTSGADEVTYEMAMENPEATSAANVEELDAGAALKTQLDEQNVTPSEQAEIFAQQSKTQTDMVSALEDEMENILKESEAASAKAEEQTQNILSQIQALNARKEQIKSAPTTPFGGLEATQINMQIKQLGQLGLGQLDITGQTIYTATNGLDDAIVTANDTNSIGSQSIDIGSKLMNEVSGNFFSSEFRAAMRAINEGGNAVDKASEGLNIFNATISDNAPFEEAINKNKNSITNASGASAIAEDEENPEAEAVEEEPTEQESVELKDNETVTVTDQAEKDQIIEDRESDIDPTLADESITSDPNEILKRKERKGLA